MWVTVISVSAAPLEDQLCGDRGRAVEWLSALPGNGLACPACSVLSRHYLCNSDPIPDLSWFNYPQPLIILWTFFLIFLIYLEKEIVTPILHSLQSWPKDRIPWGIKVLRKNKPWQKHETFLSFGNTCLYYTCDLFVCVRECVLFRSIQWFLLTSHLTFDLISHFIKYISSHFISAKRIFSHELEIKRNLQHKVYRGKHLNESINDN